MCPIEATATTDMGSKFTWSTTNLPVPPLFWVIRSFLHPGASAVNSSSPRMPRRVSLICAWRASARPKWGVGRLWGCPGKVRERRTGSGDSRGVLLVRALHLLLEHREARGL